MTYKNQNPEQIARDHIDDLLRKSGWVIQSKEDIDLNASLGVAIREYQTAVGPADYVLFVDKKPVGIIEAKKEEEGHRLTVHEDQATGYAGAKLKYINNKEDLPFVYVSTGVLTRFTNYSDPKPRSRWVFSFHRPETLLKRIQCSKTLRQRLLEMPALDETGLRKAQITAIKNLEISFQHNRPRALIQMATGAGKTFTAATFIYRLLKFAKASRILFLVDTRNLGEQAEQEFMAFQPQDDNRKFTELYNVQLLKSSSVSKDSQVCISTIQRLYSILKGEELDEMDEDANPNEMGSWLEKKLATKEPMPVVYNENIPLEFFDFIIVDECHRSIYNLWKQVLDYFDAFLIGLTATPDKRTFGFFNENVVSEYTYEASVIDGVNVPYDVYLIETDISKNGAIVHAGWYVDKRDKLTRKKRWEQMDEEEVYTRKDLDRGIVNKSQIRSVIKEFKRALQQNIFPDRWKGNDYYEVPKTLVFAKTDSHADDIIAIIREEFNESNEFCKKVTYKIEGDPKSVLNRFRNDYYPRIAVTVDMIATGTDVKPLEVLLFMRDVKSKNYFEQMKGRGTRTIDAEKLQQVSSTATAKTHFVIVDAVGVTKSKKTDSRPLERKPAVSVKDLLGAVAMNVQEEDIFLSLANRLIRLDKQITQKEDDQIKRLSGGKGLKEISRDLLAAYDPDVIEERSEELLQEIPVTERTPALINDAKQQAQTELLNVATSSFNGKLNNYVENVQREREQIIDHVNLDTVTKSEWDATSADKAEALIADFKDYIEKNKDEIVALSIFYNQPHRLKDITFEMIRSLMDKMKAEKPTLAPSKIWDAYEALGQTHTKAPQSELTALVSLIRNVCGIDKELTPYDETVNKNFQNWIFKKNAGQHNYFTPQQTQWLRMIKDHIAKSFHIEMDDLEYTPFNSEGGRGKMFQLFGKEMIDIINEMNRELVA